MKRRTAMPAIALAAGLQAALVAGMPRSACATGFTDTVTEGAAHDNIWFRVDGSLRLRANDFYNLDLDRGLTPSGAPLFPVDLQHPNSQSINYADTRLRTDVGAFAPGGTLAVKTRVDALGGGSLGSASPDVAARNGGSTGSSDTYLRVKRIYGEAVTPLGMITAGRIGSTWGLGMIANGGDAMDADHGDAANRFAFITPVAGHIWALAYDHGTVGAWTPQDATQPVGLERADDTQSVTFAVLRWNDDLTQRRRRIGGKTTLNYGAFLSHQWQNTAERGIPRGYSADGADAWVRIAGHWGRIEAEGAYLQAVVEQASTIPGVLLRDSIRSQQTGAVVESDFGAPESDVSAGIDGGYASGDPEPGFGVNPPIGALPAKKGDLDGPQAIPGYDDRIDNFRFHPDYHVDRILFREIIGTVTDAVYVRPHVRARLARLGAGDVTASLAGIASRAIYASSTPGGKVPLGVELDPTLTYAAPDGLVVALEHAVLFPLAGLDNPASGMRAHTAQLVRLRLAYQF